MGKYTGYLKKFVEKFKSKGDKITDFPTPKPSSEKEWVKFLNGLLKGEKEKPYVAMVLFTSGSALSTGEESKEFWEDFKKIISEDKELKHMDYIKKFRYPEKKLDMGEDLRKLFECQ